MLRMRGFSYPKSQSELIRAARGQRTQAEFAKELNVDRSCLCRYESEKLGAPPSVINHCLAQVATMAASKLPGSDIDRALLYSRNAVRSLERLKRGA